MKTIKDLEKMFDEKYLKLYGNNDEYGCMAIKQFIFETIIPEVLKSILGLDEGSGYYDIHLTNAIKREAKELYGIDL